MTSLHELHIKNGASLKVYNNFSVPSAYHDTITEHTAVREHVLMVDYSHMSIISVMGDDAWTLMNHFISADVSIIRDEQAIYSLILNDKGVVCGDVYVLCSSEGYYLMSENMHADVLIDSLNTLLENAPEMDIEEIPEIKNMRSDCWGAIMLEGPYAWELMAEVYGFDVIGLPYYEYMTTENDLLLLRCGKHGEFAYMLIGPEDILLKEWQQLLQSGEKYQLRAGGLDYQKIVRIENPGWDENLLGKHALNPVEMQMQWAVQYDKSHFIGQEALQAFSQQTAPRRIVGIIAEESTTEIVPGDSVMANGLTVGNVINAVFSPSLRRYVALALVDAPYAWSDITGFAIKSGAHTYAAKTKTLPFIHNLSLQVNPTDHSFVDASKAKSAAL